MELVEGSGEFSLLPEGPVRPVSSGHSWARGYLLDLWLWRWLGYLRAYVLLPKTGFSTYLTLHFNIIPSDWKHLEMVLAPFKRCYFTNI